MEFKKDDILLNKYRLDEFLGLGGFSEVWKCYDLEADQHLAVKIFLKQDQTGVALCKEEYDKMSKLMHPNILRPAFFTASAGIPYFFMPFCECGTASDRVGLMNEPEMARFVKQIAGALTYIHALPDPILHNDLKPDNFLMDDRGDYLLTDFGIGERLYNKLKESLDDDRRTQVVAEEKPAGITPRAYRAPELFTYKNHPKQKPAKASDVWALAASMYQIATGAPPFDKDGGERQHLQHELRPNALITDFLPELPDQFSRGLEKIIQQCLSFHPWDRPAASVLAESAERFLRTGSWEEIKVQDPIFYASAVALHFGIVDTQEEAVETIGFTAHNMPGKMRLAVSQPFAISEDKRNFATNLSLNLTDDPGERRVFVHFSPADSSDQQGVLTFSWNNIRMHTVELSGRGRRRQIPFLWPGILTGIAVMALIVWLVFSSKHTSPQTIPPVNPSKSQPNQLKDSSETKPAPPTLPQQGNNGSQPSILKAKSQPKDTALPTVTPGGKKNIEQMQKKRDSLHLNRGGK